jgi:energy-coupling factor transporter ATP-binding protein EcfA2
MGAGRLGESLLTLGSFSLSGFTIVGVFDKDPKRVGVKLVSSSCGTHVVEPTIKLASRVHSLNVKRGIIAVPSCTAQEAVDELVGAGVNVILSYAPTDVRVPNDVIFSRVDPATQFVRMVPPMSFPWRMSKMTPLKQTNSSPGVTPPSPSIGLARFPSMWTSFVEGSVSISINPVLLTLVSSTASLEDDLDNDNDEETSTITTNLSEEDTSLNEPPGFFEFIQSNQRFFVTQQKSSVPSSGKSLVVGLESQLETVKESLLLRDELVRTRGILLYGPSGCGKSVLLKHLALNLNETSFFFISGEEDALVAAFRAAAKTSAHSVAVVVIENLDVVCRKRAFKSAFLCCTDNPAFNSVSILASSNSPWDIDTSVLRHFERRTYVPLPDAALRAQVLKKHFSGCTIADRLVRSDFAFVARELESYSTSDVITVAKNAGLKALKTGETLTRADLSQSASIVRPTFCRELLPLYDSFSERFGTNHGGKHVHSRELSNSTYLSMYS